MELAKVLCFLAGGWVGGAFEMELRLRRLSVEIISYSIWVGVQILASICPMPPPHPHPHLPSPTPYPHPRCGKSLPARGVIKLKKHILKIHIFHKEVKSSSIILLKTYRSHMFGDG